MQGISQVYVLGDSSKVNMKIIKTGPTYRDGYVVEEGLSAGDKIAFGGTSLLLRNKCYNSKETDWKPGMPTETKESSK
ncbi:MAG: hypothetical protein U0W24_14050 [Bacteroidales bacterium]